MRSFFNSSKAAIFLLLALLAAFTMSITYSKYYNKLDLDPFSLNVTPASTPEPILAPSDTWFTQGGTSVTRASITEIEIKDSYTPTGTAGTDYIAWDASAAKNGSVMAYVEGTKLTIAGNGSGKIYANPASDYVFSDSSKTDFFSNVSTIDNVDLLDTSKVVSAVQMFRDCSSLTALDLSNWNTDTFTTIQSMFANCSSLTTLDVSNWDTSHVENMQTVFNACAFTELDVSNWDTGAVTTMTGMFQDCSSLTTLDVSNWDTSAVKLMNNIFNECANLSSLDVSNWDTGAVTTMRTMFQQCSNLTTLDVSNWDTSSATDMTYMFNMCTNLSSLDVSNWDTGAVTTMRTMFQQCSNLTTLDVSNWDTGAVTTMQNMFNECTNLSSLDVSNWDTSACTTMERMFNKCTALTELDVSNWDVSKVTTMKSMFNSGGGSYSIDNGTFMAIQKLDVSKWDTSSCTDMSFMFYGCKGPGTVDISGWDVSKVTTFDHMFAHSYLDVGDVSQWTTSSATCLNALFHSVQSTVLDLSNFDTDQVTAFSQMFDACTKLTKIIGLENFDTASGVCFSEMFQWCHNLQQLDLSSFDTTKAKDGVSTSANGSTSETMANMFTGINRLQKITLGSKFSFVGDGTTTDATHHAVLPKPYGYSVWYRVSDGEAFAPEDVPGMTAAVYVAVLNTDVLEETYQFEYYSTLGAAVTDVNNGTIGENADVDKADAVAGIYTDNGNAYVVLLKDSTETTISPAVDMTINLGGNTLTATSAIGIDVVAGNVTIDGRLDGSTVQASIIESSTTKLIQAQSGSTLSVNGGSYNVENTSGNASCAAIYTNTSTNLTATNCDIRASANSKTAAAVYHYGSVTISNCKIDAYNSVDSSLGIYGANASTNDTVYNCEITANSDADDTIARAVCYKGTLTISDCKLTATSASEVHGLYGFSNAEVTAKDCDIITTSSTGTNYGVRLGANSTGEISGCNIKATSTDGQVWGISNFGDTATISNCDIKATSTGGQACGINNSGDTATISIANCDIKATSTGKRARGINNAGASATISDSTIKAYSNYSSDLAQSATGVGNSGTTTLNNCNVTGVHSGVQSSGTLEVNGGTYEGYGHGGFYFSGADTTSYVSNAIIRQCAIPDGYSDLGAGCNGAGFYIGGGSGNNNITVYMDNCEIYGARQPIVLRGTDGEQNNVLYISNSTVTRDGTGQLVRIDNDTHKLYIGTGCNITADDASLPGVVTQTDEVYTKE